jgi:hypothetical protein
LRTLILLTASIAVWMTFFINRRHNASLEARITAMRPLAHELEVVDAKKIAVVKLEEYWFDENRWEMYLPDGQYRLCLATRGIDQLGFPPAAKSAPLAAGRHRIDLEHTQDGAGWQIAVSWDKTRRLAVQEPKEWGPGRASEGGGQFSVSEQSAPEQPVVLFRRRFYRSGPPGTMSSPSGPAEGVLLWIERVAGPKARP